MHMQRQRKKSTIARIQLEDSYYPFSTLTIKLQESKERASARNPEKQPRDPEQDIQKQTLPGMDH